MLKRPNRWIVLLSVLLAGLLSGCLKTLAPVQVIERGALASVTEVALAIAPDGTRHYAWTECSGENADYTCVLVYTRMVMGAVTYSHGFVVPIGTVARYPDVAVSSTGEAYVVYSECSAGVCVDYWTIFPAGDPTNVKIGTSWLHTSALHSEGAPQLVARGTDVYAAYYLDEGGPTRLRYRQLSGGSLAGHIDTTTVLPSDVSLGIDSTGSLHAVWLRNLITETEVVYSNNTGAVNEFHGADEIDSNASHPFTRPDLALDDDDRVYLAYALNNAANDTITVQCLDAAIDCYRGVTTLTVPQVSGNWNLTGNANLEMISDRPNVVFAASTASISPSEVWWYNPPDSGGDNPPDRVTKTNGVSEGEPLIVEENSDVGDVPVIAWRQFAPFIAAVQSPAGFPSVCEGDVFYLYGFADSITENTSQVFEDRGTCVNSGLDLAANGQWVAGVWLDRESNVIAAHAAWTAFNAHVSYVPVATK